VDLGVRNDKPESVARIPKFIKDYSIDTTSIRDPLSSFTTLNEFFYRHLKPELRPIYEPTNPLAAVQPADCRLITFDSVDEATRLWIKGKNFSFPSLLEDRSLAQNYIGGSFMICRLAPTDYHRFHSPVDGTVGAIRTIGYDLYSVKPMIVNGPLDVLTENLRSCMTIQSEEFGAVMYIAVGATQVGSIRWTVKTGDRVKKGQELGYFAYGGSTLVVLFERNKILFDADLRHRSKTASETLVKFGQSLGRAA
jgi:phosphatidylserine decarboxylase